MVRQLKFHDPYPPLKQDLRLFLKKIPFVLPNRYIELLREQDGGFLDYEFTYQKAYSHESLWGGIGIMYGLSHKYNLVKQYNHPPEFFPQNVVPFGENGGGDMVCFDYRSNPKTTNPPIVYWEHEEEEGKDVSFIAKDFEEFLSILKEPED